MPPQNDSNKYQKLSDIEHVLHAPDTYIGSVEPNSIYGWTFENGKIRYKNFTFISGLYKIYDEALVNARDHYIRMGQKNKSGEECFPVKNISVDISKCGTITIKNDGDGIDIIQHDVHKLWVPEMIFAHLRTSTNYNKGDKKLVGGKNGFGVKLLFIYSTFGEIETIDSKRGLKYKQTFENNLSIINKPSITKCKSKPYTKITFKPDFKKFNIENITPDMLSVMTRRIYDISAVTDKSVNVKFNGELLGIRTFESYINLYIGDKETTQRVYESGNDRWEYAVCISPLEEFTHISCVNGIFTNHGGTHVNYILNQIVKKITAIIEKKKKVKVKPTTIKEQLMIFVNCMVENPAFDSQTKDILNTPVSKFGSSVEVSDKFIDKVIKLGVMDTALSLTQAKDTSQNKKTDGKKTSTIRGIPKLIDANRAGTKDSQECILILTEGDSAKAGVVSGLTANDRNYIGVYPLKGKMINVRNISEKKYGENKECIELKKIMGLETNKIYTKENIGTLRYGKILLLTDQDLDGAHIQGLVINVFESKWNSLLKIDGFISYMNTPILKAKKGTQSLPFYSEVEYNEWKLKQSDISKWKIKYYKGLGTSTGKEFKEYFKDNKFIGFEYDSKSKHVMDMVFDKSSSDSRKEWLSNYDKYSEMIVSKHNSVTYTDFFNKRMIHFSKYDCERSIPNLVDGLKTSQRKILFSAFKRKLYSEIKVAQFAGYVSEHSGYHHGENSLNQAIVSMAQTYVGSNNINIFLGKGQFGTRWQGGKDSASERYIFTELNPITKTLFNKNDSNVLEYLDDDGTIVEPEFYVPIIPMVIVNGVKAGIGTGYSCNILPYNPTDIINVLLDKLSSKEPNYELMPYFNNFIGTVEKENSSKFVIRGIYKINNNIVNVSELPVGIWIEDYKIHLEKLIERGTIKSYQDNSTDTKIDFNITFINNESIMKLHETLSEYGNKLEELLKLYNTKTTNNMHLFDKYQRIKHYSSIKEIIDEYYDIRIEYYNKRKEYLINELNHIVLILKNKANFIREQCEDTIDLRRKKQHEISAILKSKTYDIIDNDENYGYLVSMPISSIMEENITKLESERDKKAKDLDFLTNKKIEDMWIDELQQLLKEISKKLS